MMHWTSEMDDTMNTRTMWIRIQSTPAMRTLYNIDGPPSKSLNKFCCFYAEVVNRHKSGIEIHSHVSFPCFTWSSFLLLVSFLELC